MSHLPFNQVVSEQRLDLPLLATTETCSGKTYIVSGANTGLGLEAARHLVALRSARVILAVRNLAAGEAAKADILDTTGRRDDVVVEVWPLDLASYDSVKSFAQRATNQLDRIDGLVENAGVALLKWSVTQGHESSIAINVLSTLLLAILVFPKMVETAQRFATKPHIVVVSSESGFSSKAQFDKIKDDPIARLDDDKLLAISGRYPLSKLIQIISVRQLASVLPVSQTGVILNTVNPGLCKTDLSRNAKDGGLGMRLMIGVMKTILGRTAEMGSRTLLHAVAAGEESHGCYLSACEIKEDQVPSWVTNAEGKQGQKRVWAAVASELESIAPGCMKRLTS